MIDIHSHILPGVDDGSQSIDESLEMLSIAVAQGVKTQVLTPHIQLGRFNNNKSSLIKPFLAFKQTVEEAKLPIELKLSAEVRIGPEIMQLVANNEIPWLSSVQGKKVFLLEFPRQEVPFGSDNLIKWLLANKCLPIIVHPERNRTFVDNPKKLQPFIDLGCPLQVTASSLTGKFGDDVQKMAETLLGSGTAKYIASDCHNLKGRRPDLGEVLSTLPEEIKNNVIRSTQVLMNGH